jgi:hypothetical protein
MRLLQFGLWLLVAVLAAGCATTSLKPAGEFAVLASDPRVLYEPGAETQAQRVADLLPAAIAEVEQAHYRAFLRPVTVYVCGTPRCFSSHVTSQNVSAATVPDNRIFLSPRLFDTESQRLPLILAHELSHLHLGQQIGHYSYTVPVWFHEGLAAYASDGGGAEYATEEQAAEAIKHGQTFTPGTLDTPLTRHKAEYWKLPTYVFYREALMFVEYLRSLGEARFRDFLLGVENDEDFALAFGNTYNMTLTAAGKRFSQRFTGDPRPIQAARAPGSPAEPSTN